MSIAVEDWDNLAEAPRKESRLRGRRRAAKEEAAAAKAPPAAKSAPAAEKRAPAAKPAPAAETRAPAPRPVAVAEQPAPAPKPAPKAEKRAHAPTPAAEKPAPTPAPAAEKPAAAPTPTPVAEQPAPAPTPTPVAEKPAPAPTPTPVAEKPAPAPEHAQAAERAPSANVAPVAAVIATAEMQEAAASIDDCDELSDTPLRRRLRGRTRVASPAAETWDAYAPEVPPAAAVIATAEMQEAAASVDDWGELSEAPLRRSLRGLARAASRATVAPARRDEDEGNDYAAQPSENLRLPLCLAAANILIWLLARMSGVVELIGVSFAASVGMLLAAYILREWQRDRSALIYLVGALPLPITIFALIA